MYSNSVSRILGDPSATVPDSSLLRPLMDDRKVTTRVVLPTSARTTLTAATPRALPAAAAFWRLATTPSSTVAVDGLPSTRMTLPPGKSDAHVSIDCPRLAPTSTTIPGSRRRRGGDRSPSSSAPTDGEAPAPPPAWPSVSRSSCRSAHRDPLNALAPPSS